MTTKHNFLPGDLIINHNGDLVTVKAKPNDPDQAWRDDTGCYVYWHNLKYPEFSHSNSHADHVKRPPISVGDWVRVIGPTREVVEKYHGEIAQVESVTPGMIRTRAFGALSCENWSTHNLAPVAALDVARRVMTEQRKALEVAENDRLDAIGERDEANAAIVEAAQIVRKYALRMPPDLLEWADKYCPKPAATFKRGDLVIGGIHRYPAHIISLTDCKPGMMEIIYVSGPFAGLFECVTIADFEHF